MGSNDPDRNLLNVISTQQAWDLARVELFEPMRRDESCVGRFKRIGFPNAQRTADEAREENAFVGSSEQLTMIALIHHFNMTNNITNDAWQVRQQQQQQQRDNVVDALANVSMDFDEETARRRFYSMTFGPGGREESWSCDRDWYGVNDVARPFNRGADEVYQWPAGSDSPTQTVVNRDAWARHYAPLQFHRWLVPGSALNDLAFTMDRNTVFLYAWYNDFLTKVANYREKIEAYAKARRTNNQLRTRYDKLVAEFVERDRTVRNRRLSSVDQPALARNQPAAAIAFRFQRELNRLYAQFVESTRLVNEGRATTSSASVASRGASTQRTRRGGGRGTG